MCTACADACLSEDMVAELTTCIRTNLDCADICATTGRALSRHTGYDANLTRACLTTSTPGITAWAAPARWARTARGQDFEALWLQMMIEHHEGAVEMAQTEQEEGVFHPAQELAASIETSQVTQISHREELLGS